MKGYGQFCPIAKAAEILCERWTILVIRELVFGSRHYNELRRGLPRMSPTLLAQRLRMLEEAGVVRVSADRGGKAYDLTEAGAALRPLVRFMARWAHRWAASELDPEETDPRFLMWAIRRNIRPQHFPRRRCVVSIEFDGCPRHLRRWWIVVEKGEADLCERDPGFEVDACLQTDPHTLARLFECRASLAEVTASGRLRLVGARDVVGSMKRWFGRPAEHDTPAPVPL